MQQLINYINKYAKLDQDAIAELGKRAEIEKYPKGRMILEAGQICNKIWYIKSGMVRKFHLHDGKEVTVWMHCENEIITSLHSYFSKSPTSEYIQACETTELIGINRHNSEQLALFSQFVTFSNTLMGEQFACVDMVSREFSKMDAKQRYKYLCQIAPNMVQRAKLGHIASIIGITQETLSRIRKQL